MDNRPIGVFDSGVGGLTVVKEIYKQLPQEDIIYFGDTAHLPYGPKSQGTIRHLVRNNIRFLLDEGVKLVILACHTASAFALEIKREVDVPVTGVIKPGAEEALRVSKNKKIGVIGTYGTVNSGAYHKELKALDPRVSVISRSCPLFVPLVEEGWIEKEVTSLIIEEYLEPLRKEGVDTLILGCTHYPLLKKEIFKVMDGVRLIDSARTTVSAIKRMLEKKNLLKEQKAPHSSSVFFVTDAPERFIQVGQIFLGRNIEKVNKIDLFGITR